MNEPLNLKLSTQLSSAKQRQGFRFSKRDYDRLDGVLWPLVQVMEVSITLSPAQFMIVEGMRTLEQQRIYVAKGASTTMNSRHLTGHAVDIAPLIDGKVRWDWPLYSQIAPVIKGVAQDLGIAIVWGGDWKRFPDGPHFELDRRVYP